MPVGTRLQLVPARHPVIELADDGSQRRSCAGGGSHVRQLGRRPSAPLDMVDCLAATRSWLQQGRPRSCDRERSVISLGIRSQGAARYYGLDKRLQTTSGRSHPC